MLYHLSYLARLVLNVLQIAGTLPMKFHGKFHGKFHEKCHGKFHGILFRGISLKKINEKKSVKCL
jgi:hypothetical protein